MNSYRESAVTFGPDRSLVGVVTTPVGNSPNDRPTIVIPNAGVVHRAGPNRLHVRLARALAPLGHVVFRFDHAGIGDSDPRLDETDLARAVHADMRDALAFLESEHGAKSFVICGLCSGANNGFRFATADERVAGAVLIDPVAFRTPRFYVTHYAPQLVRVQPWLNVFSGRHPAIRKFLERTSGRHAVIEPQAPPGVEHWEPSKPEMDEGLSMLIARGAQLLFVYTGGLRDQFNYPSQFRDMFPQHADSDCVHVEYLPEADHTFSAERSKATLLALVSDWLGGEVWRGERADYRRRDASYFSTSSFSSLYA